MLLSITAAGLAVRYSGSKEHGKIEFNHRVGAASRIRIEMAHATITEYGLYLFYAMSVIYTYLWYCGCSAYPSLRSNLIVSWDWFQLGLFSKQ